MLIVSWNVAAWKKTVENIWEHHKSSLGKGTSSSVGSGPAAKAAVLVEYLTSMGVDILCLQEVKIDKLKLNDCAMMIGARSGEFDVFFGLPAGGDSSGSGGVGNGKSTSRQQSGGLNGVATYVRKGLTCGACSTALDDGGELDKEGRCILTDHGSFVVFNVYVPNGQGGQRMIVKQAFLLALKAAMEKERQRGVKVILCGDLNIHYRAQDCFKYWRRINVNAMLYEPSTYLSKTIALDVGTYRLRKKGDETFEKKFEAFLCYLRNEWKDIEDALLNTLHITTESWNNEASSSSTTTTGSNTNVLGGIHTGVTGPGAKSGNKSIQVAVKLKVRHPTTKKEIILKTKRENVSPQQANADGGLASGTADTVSRMKWSFNLGGRYVNGQSVSISAEEYNLGLVRGEHVMQVKKEGCLDVEDLRKAISMLCSSYFDPDTAETVSSNPYAHGREAKDVYDRKMDAYWDAIATNYGDVAASQVDVQWMHKILGLSDSKSESKDAQSQTASQEVSVMVDPFAQVRANCDDRFTIWNQYANERYRNEGTRIDFTLCDKALWDEYGKIGGSMEGYVNAKIAAAANERGVAIDKRYIETDEAIASLNAATNFNAFQQAPFDGGGMPRASDEAYNTHLRGHHKTAQEPLGHLHTGIIYTPPEYSDHVAVSLFLDDTIKSTMSLPLKLRGDKATRAAQPHLKQQTISSFFGPPGSSSSSSSAKSTNTDVRVAKRSISDPGSDANKKSKGALTNFFDRKVNS